MNPTCKKRLGVIRLETMKVVAQEEIAPAIFELVLEGEMVEAMRAGQFLHLRVPDDAHLFFVLFQFRLLTRQTSSVTSFIGLRELGLQFFQP
ncbi:dihydroorotate dehydrogenase electron transfer subunit [Streptococcus pneumoniae]|nr:dihydroorotate dehydrogenase electron transfer subunit [Streptococcus pneumoniae]